jgi:hypothetical protein
MRLGDSFSNNQSASQELRTLFHATSSKTLGGQDLRLNGLQAGKLDSAWTLNQSFYHLDHERQGDD